MARVIATKRGFYGKLREPGEVFTYPMGPKDKMPSWMRVAKAEDSKSAKKSAKSADDMLE